MKGIISGIKRMEIHDGAGLRTTVFFKGCPLRCIWCHNPESLSPAPQIAFFEAKCCGCGSCKLVCPEEAADGGVDFSKCSQCLQCAQVCPTGALTIYGQEYEADELAELLMQDAVFFETSGGGVTLSGGECLMQPDFAVELAQKLHQKGISVDVDTCGFLARSALERILPYTDEFLYDLKAIDAQVHRKCTGQDNTVVRSRSVIRWWLALTTVNAKRSGNFCRILNLPERSRFCSIIPLQNHGIRRWAYPIPCPTPKQRLRTLPMRWKF